MERREIEDLIHRVIGCMIDVYKEVGRGFTETVYHRALELELAHQGIGFESEQEIELEYRGRSIGTHRLDL